MLHERLKSRTVELLEVSLKIGVGQAYFNARPLYFVSSIVYCRSGVGKLFLKGHIANILGFAGESL